MNRFIILRHVGGTAFAAVMRFDGPKMSTAAAQYSGRRVTRVSTANPPAGTPIRSASTQSCSCSHFDRVLPVLHVAAAPVALDEPLVRLAVPRRASDVGRHHGDAAAEQVLVERVVEGSSCASGPPWIRHGHPPVGLRSVEPGRDLAPVEARVADQLDVDELFLARCAHAALRGRAHAGAARLRDPHFRRAAGADRITATCEPSSESATGGRKPVRCGRAPAGSPSGKFSLTVAAAQVLPAVDVDEPGEHAAVARGRHCVDIGVGSLDPLEAGGEVVEREPRNSRPSSVSK